MPDMPAMAMPHVAASFLGMWAVMMAAMMLPSFLPILWRYRRAMKQRGSDHPYGLSALVSIGYFSVWTALGLVVFLLMQVPAIAHAAPLASAFAMLIAGALQFTTWKAHHLACCRSAARQSSSGNDAGTALRHGLRLGFHCSCCCAGSTAILLATGLMDVSAMVLATAAITAERLAPSGEKVARLIGTFVVAGGAWLAAQAV